MIVCWDCSLPFNVMGSFGPVCLLCAFTDCIYKTLFVLLPLQFEMWVQLKAVIIRNNIPKSFHGSYLGYSYVVKMDKVWNLHFIALHYIVGLDFMNLLVQLLLDHCLCYRFLLCIKEKGGGGIISRWKCWQNKFT